MSNSTSFRARRVTVPITIAASGTAGNNGGGLALYGILRGILVNAPAMTGTSITVAITDDNGYTTFSKASIGVNGKNTYYVDTNNQPYQLPLSGSNYTLTITSNGTEASQRSLSVDLLILGN